jgi:hypothetical protein
VAVAAATIVFIVVTAVTRKRTSLKTWIWKQETPAAPLMRRWGRMTTSRRRKKEGRFA